MGGSACLWARERPAAARRPNVWRSRTLPEGGFTPHEDVEETGSPEAWNTRFREKSGTKTRNCPSGPWRPWDSWIWSERAAPLAFGRAASKRPAEPDLWGGEFRRPGGEFLSRRWERNQRIAGDAADGLRLRFAPPRSIGPLSPDPITEDAYLSGFTMVPAREA